MDSVRPPRFTPSELPSRMRTSQTLAHHPWSIIISSLTPYQQGHSMLQLQVSTISARPRKSLAYPGLSCAITRASRGRHCPQDNRSLLHVCPDSSATASEIQNIDLLKEHRHMAADPRALEAFSEFARRVTNSRATHFRPPQVGAITGGCRPSACKT